jgi:hypothetical protein
MTPLLLAEKTGGVTNVGTVIPACPRSEDVGELLTRDEDSGGIVTAAPIAKEGERDAQLERTGALSMCHFAGAPQFSSDFFRRGSELGQKIRPQRRVSASNT